LATTKTAVKELEKEGRGLLHRLPIAVLLFLFSHLLFSLVFFLFLSLLIISTKATNGF